MLSAHLLVVAKSHPWSTTANCAVVLCAVPLLCHYCAVLESDVVCSFPDEIVSRADCSMCCAVFCRHVGVLPSCLCFGVTYVLCRHACPLPSRPCFAVASMFCRHVGALSSCLFFAVTPVLCGNIRVLPSGLCFALTYVLCVALHLDRATRTMWLP